MQCWCKSIRTNNITLRETVLVLGRNQDLLFIQDSSAAPTCENYAKLYFDAIHLEKDGEGGGAEIFVALFSINQSINLSLTYDNCDNEN